jgi:branched-chain amino acid transport system substrate-binding protein
LFFATGGSKWGDYKKYPWTMGFQPSFRTEGQVYAKYILRQNPATKIAVLYQNDDLGKDYLAGVKDVLGGNFGKVVVTASYELTDATIDNQLNSLQASGADALLVAASAKCASQSIRKVYDSNWRPIFCMANVSTSVAAVLEPAGTEKAIGLISAGYLKDPTDPAFKDDPGMQEWHTFMAKYLPSANVNDSFYVIAYSLCRAMLQVLRQCVVAGCEFQASQKCLRLIMV